MAWLPRRWTPALWALLLLCACDDGAAGEADAGEDDAATEQDGAADDAGASKDRGPVAQTCEVTAPTSCPEPPVYYEDITPIIKQRCYSCHDGKGAQWGLTSYSHVADWSNELRSAMASCVMPPPEAGITMPAAEREKILTWLVCKMPQREAAAASDGH